MIQDMLEQVILHMKEQNAKQIKTIELDIGMSSGYSMESLKQAFDVIVADLDFKDTNLVMNQIDGNDVILKSITFED